MPLMGIHLAVLAAGILWLCAALIDEKTKTFPKYGQQRLVFLISTQRKATLMSALSRNLCIMGCIGQICIELQCSVMEMSASPRVRLKTMGTSPEQIAPSPFTINIKNVLTHSGQKRGAVLSRAAVRHHLRQRPLSVKLRSNYTERTKVTESQISLSDVPKPRNSWGNSRLLYSEV